MGISLKQIVYLLLFGALSASTSITTSAVFNRKMGLLIVSDVIVNIIFSNDFLDLSFIEIYRISRKRISNKGHNFPLCFIVFGLIIGVV